MKAFLDSIFLHQPYRKMLIVWRMQEGQTSKTAEEQYQIKVVEMRGILAELLKSTRGAGSRDDVLRVFELISLARREEDKMIKSIAKKVRKARAKTVA